MSNHDCRNLDEWRAGVVMAERLDDLARSFSRHLRAEGKAPRTAVIYGQAVTFYSPWLADQGREPVVDELTPAAVREWLAQLADRGQEASTVRTRYKGLHRFCSWLVDEGELAVNPLAGLEPPVAQAKPV